jgi:prevent-host-death family protein
MRDLRAQLASVLRRAGSGERIVVTVDGRPVAQVGPLDAIGLASSLPDLVSRNLVVPPRRRGDFIAPAPISLYSGVRVEKAVSEIRS